MVLRRIDDRPDFYGVETMKNTKKQKQRQKEAKRRQADDRRYDGPSSGCWIYSDSNLFVPSTGCRNPRSCS